MTGRALLIVNRKSRNGAAELAQGIESIGKLGLEISEEYPDDPADVPELIRRYRDRIDRVILGGGDGTMNCAAETLMETRLPLAILPLGTANDLARTLCIPAGLPEALRVAVQGCLHPVDLGCVNGKYFFNVAHIGLGVWVAHDLSGDLKARWGVLGYPRSLLRAIREYRSFRAEIRQEEKARLIRTIQISVGNGRHYGGGMTLAEDAFIDDHRLRLYSLRPLRLWELIRLAPALRSGRYEQRDEVHALEGREFEVRTPKPMPVTADGEPIAQTPARFRVVPEAVSVYVSQEYLRQREENSDADERQTDRD